MIAASLRVTPALAAAEQPKPVNYIDPSSSSWMLRLAAFTPKESIQKSQSDVRLNDEGLNEDIQWTFVLGKSGKRKDATIQASSSQNYKSDVQIASNVPCTNFRDRGLIGFWALMNEEFEGPDVDDMPCTALQDMQAVAMAVGGGMEDGVDSSVESTGTEDVEGKDEIHCSFEHGVKNMNMQFYHDVGEYDVEDLATNRHLSCSL